VVRKDGSASPVENQPEEPHLSGAMANPCSLPSGYLTERKAIEERARRSTILEERRRMLTMS